MVPFRTRLLAVTALFTAGLTVSAVVPRLTAQAPSVIRGPYLQLGTPTSVVIRWRTSSPTDSVVRYGAVPGALTTSSAVPGARTEHEVVLTGLAPHTRYAYSVGTSSAALAGGDSGHAFTTSPPAGAVAPVRLWVLGDSGTADATARAVRDAYLAQEPSSGTQLVLMLGDNAYPTGTDANYQAAVFDTFPTMLRRAVLWPTVGNHDAISADSATQSGPYFDAFTLPTAGEAGGVPSGTEAYYSFDYANIHVVCLDSSESDRSASGPMATWLRADLAGARAAWTIAFFHHAPYSRGTHDSDADPAMREMRESIVPLLEAGGVDLVLAGHSHDYERSQFISGHYGPAASFGPAHVIDASGEAGFQKARGATAGAIYAVAGSSGTWGPGPLDHPAMRVAYATSGSMILDIEGDRLDAAYVSGAGRIDDRFTMVKHDAAGPPGAPPRAALSEADPSRLEWSPATGGGRVEGYRLEGGSAPGRSDLGTLALGPRLSLALPRVPGRHVLRVRAYNADGLGPASDDVPYVVDQTGTDVLPPAPTGVVTAQVAGASVDLAWPFDVRDSTSRLDVGTRPGTSDLGRVFARGGLAAAGVPPGVYYVRYRRVNAAGESPPSVDTAIVVGGVAGAPARPGRPRASVVGRTVTFAWEPPAGGAPVAHYLIDAGRQPGAAEAGVSSSGPAPSFHATGVPPGAYYLRVRAWNAVGAGLPSDEVRVVVP
ncbi:MAG: fibronectin type III domain-containing protein [Vicinamibacterales bacterium]